jgi:rubrerythrin
MSSTEGYASDRRCPIAHAGKSRRVKRVVEAATHGEEDRFGNVREVIDHTAEHWVCEGCGQTFDAAALEAAAP